MPTGTIAPFPYHQFFDASGNPLAGAKLFCYAAGTSTKQNTYSDSALSSANANPIILDSAGRSKIFLLPTSYKFIMAPSTDTDPPTSPLWTIDNVSAVPPANIDLDITATAGEALTANDVVYLSEGSGSRTAGRWYKTDADFTYASTTATAIGVVVANIASGADGSVRVVGRMTGFAGLTIGSVYYASATAGALTSTPPTNARAIGVADSSSSIILSQWIPIATASATQAGIVSISAQTLAGVKSFNDHPQFEAGSSSGGTYSRCVGTVFKDSVQHQNTSTTETTLSTHSLDANTLDVDGSSVRLTAWGTFTGAGTKTIKAYFGATSITLVAAVTDNLPWSLVFEVMRRSGTTQIASLRGSYRTGGNQLYIDLAASPAETLSGAITIKTTGQSTGGTGEVVQNGCRIEVL